MAARGLSGVDATGNEVVILTLHPQGFTSMQVAGTHKGCPYARAYAIQAPAQG